MEVAIDTANVGHLSQVALIIHGWNDDPTAGWLGWLNVQLGKRGYQVRAPHLDNRERPLLKRWRAQLSPLMQDLNERSIIVAHSLGCFIVLRLLESISMTSPIGQVVLVSGFYDAPGEAVTRFFEPEPNWPHIRQQAKRFTCVYSDNDAIVTPDRTHRLVHKLDAEIVMLADKGHFLGSKGMKTLPEILELID